MKENVINWSANQREFIHWFATPDSLKEVRQEYKFAEKIKVNPITLWRWKNLPGFYVEVQKETRQFLGHRLPEILEALNHEACKGSFQHQKLLLEMLGMYVQKIAPTNPEGTESYASTSDADLKARASAIIARGSGDPDKTD